MAKKVASTSPTVKPPATVGFGEIVQPLLDGKRVTKLEWNNRDIYLVLRDGHLKIHKADTNMLHDLIVTDGDLAGLDYVVLE